MIVNRLLQELVINLMGDLAIGYSLVIGLQLVANDPFWILAQQGQSACSIDHHRLLLQYQGIADGWIAGIEAEVDAEAGHHAGQDDVIGVFALTHPYLDDINQMLSRWVL
jgi:hypothetical protein